MKFCINNGAKIPRNGLYWFIILFLIFKVDLLISNSNKNVVKPQKNNIPFFPMLNATKTNKINTKEDNTLIRKFDKESDFQYVVLFIFK